MMNTRRIDLRSGRLLAAGLLLLLLAVPASAQETTFLMDFNGASGEPEGGIDLVAESGSTERGNLWYPDEGLPGVRARFNTYVDALLGSNTMGTVSSLVFGAAMDQGASGEEGDHAVFFTVGEGSRSFNANLFIAAPDLELDPNDPLSGVVSVDFKAPAGEKICVRVETGRWDNFGPIHTLGARFQYVQATGEWQTFSYTLGEGETDESLKFLDVGSHRLARVIVQWVNPQHSGTMLIDNVRLENVQRVDE